MAARLGGDKGVGEGARRRPAPRCCAAGGPAAPSRPPCRRAGPTNSSRSGTSSTPRKYVSSTGAARRFDPAEAAALDDRGVGRLAELVEVVVGELGHAARPRAPPARRCSRRPSRHGATAGNWRGCAMPPPGSSPDGIACRRDCRARPSRRPGRRNRWSRAPRRAIAAAQRIGVDEIGVGARRQSGEQRVAPGGNPACSSPSAAASAPGGVHRRDLAGDPAEARRGAVLEAALGHQLHADADAEERPAGGDHRLERLDASPAPRQGRARNRRRRRGRAARCDRRAATSSGRAVTGDLGRDARHGRRRGRAPASAEARLPEP